MSALRPRQKEDSETILEYALDTLSTLPFTLKRSYAHIATLDTLATSTKGRLRALEDSYLGQCEGKVREFVSANGEGGKIPTTAELQNVVSQQVQKPKNIDKLQENITNIAQEKLNTATQTLTIVQEHLYTLETQLTNLEKNLKSTSSFTVPTIQPNTLVACQPITNANNNPAQAQSDEWILGKVLSYSTSKNMYVIMDEDIDANPQTYNLYEDQVRTLGATEKISKGDLIYAVYPDTTSFYQATVVAVKRREGGGGGYGGGGGSGTGVVYVNFIDDMDEMGITHDKPVGMQYVMKM